MISGKAKASGVRVGSGSESYKRENDGGEAAPSPQQSGATTSSAWRHTGALCCSARWGMRAGVPDFWARQRHSINLEKAVGFHAKGAKHAKVERYSKD